MLRSACDATSVKVRATRGVLTAYTQWGGGGRGCQTRWSRGTCTSGERVGRSLGGEEWEIQVEQDVDDVGSKLEWMGRLRQESSRWSTAFPVNIDRGQDGQVVFVSFN